MRLQPEGCSGCTDPNCERLPVGRIQLCAKCWTELRRGREDPVTRTLRCEWCCGGGLREDLTLCHKCEGSGRRAVVFTRDRGERDDTWEHRERAWDQADFIRTQEMWR